MSAAAIATAAAAKICLIMTSSHKYEGRPTHIGWMDNRGLSHSFAACRAARIFVMRDEGMFISRCGKNKSRRAFARRLGR
jgi:hypothetical protein